MSSIVSSLLFSIAGLIVGFVGGQIIAWKRYGSLIVPTYHPRQGQRRADFVIGILVVILALATMIQGVVSQQRQGDCNDEFRRVIAERGTLTQRQNAANVELQERLVELSPSVPENVEKRQEARQRYVDEIREIDAQKSRNPYPDPRC